MKKDNNLIGKKFNRLLVIEQLPDRICNDGHHRRIWLCKCECGNYVKELTASLNNGSSKSCGCLQKDIVKEKCYKHGKCNHKLYTTYYGVKQRCYNSNSSNYNRYGGRGIKMCDEWLYSFENFYNWAINNGFKQELTLDRIDNNGNYEPNNCRWVTNMTQSNNTSRNKYIEYNGKKHTISEWSKLLNFKHNVIPKRLEMGWSIERTLTTPLQIRFSHERRS